MENHSINGFVRICSPTLVLDALAFVDPSMYGLSNKMFGGRLLTEVIGLSDDARNTLFQECQSIMGMNLVNPTLETRALQSMCASFYEAIGEPCAKVGRAYADNNYYKTKFAFVTPVGPNSTDVAKIRKMKLTVDTFEGFMFGVLGINNFNEDNVATITSPNLKGYKLQDVEDRLNGLLMNAGASGNVKDNSVFDLYLLWSFLHPTYAVPKYVKGLFENISRRPNSMDKVIAPNPVSDAGHKLLPHAQFFTTVAKRTAFKTDFFASTANSIHSPAPIEREFVKAYDAEGLYAGFVEKRPSIDPKYDGYTQTSAVSAHYEEEGEEKLHRRNRRERPVAAADIHHGSDTHNTLWRQAQRDYYKAVKATVDVRDTYLEVGAGDGGCHDYYKSLNYNTACFLEPDEESYAKLVMSMRNAKNKGHNTFINGSFEDHGFPHSSVMSFSNSLQHVCMDPKSFIRLSYEAGAEVIFALLPNYDRIYGNDDQAKIGDTQYVKNNRGGSTTIFKGGAVVIEKYIRPMDFEVYNTVVEVRESGCFVLVKMVLPHELPRDAYEDILLDTIAPLEEAVEELSRNLDDDSVPTVIPGVAEHVTSIGLADGFAQQAVSAPVVSSNATTDNDLELVLPHYDASVSGKPDKPENAVNYALGDLFGD